MRPITEQADDGAARAERGERAIAWARQHMPVLASVRETFADEQPLAGERVGLAMHVEATTAVLAETLAAGGAEVAVAGCNPLSTEDDVSAALDAADGVTSYARHGVDEAGYYDALDAVAAHDPTITIDDGADLVARLHEHHPERIAAVRGGCEETTTGVHRLRAMAADGELSYPVFAVNDTPTKRLFDNVHGTGESVLVTIASATNLQIAGSTVVIAGYGHCGEGLATKAAGLGAHVVVTEVDPRRALAAHADGHEVRPMSEAAPDGDLFVTSTGVRDVITREHLDRMSDGAVLANAGHFDVEVDVDALADLAVDRTEPRPGVETFVLGDGRRLHLLAEGRLVNLAMPGGDGHPVEVMDQSFALQALCAREIAAGALDDAAGVRDVPDAVDREVAATKLAAEGVAHDELTDEQRAYRDEWREGT